MSDSKICSSFSPGLFENSHGHAVPWHGYASNNHMMISGENCHAEKSEIPVRRQLIHSNSGRAPARAFSLRPNCIYRRTCCGRRCNYRGYLNNHQVNPFQKSFVTGISKLTRYGLTAQTHPDPEDGRIPIGPGDVISAGSASPILARLPIKDFQLGDEKRLVGWTCGLRFGSNFFEKSLSHIVRKIKGGFLVVVHVVSIVLVDRNRTSISKPPRPVIDQSQVNAVDVIVARVVKRIKSQIGGFVAQRRIDLNFAAGGQLQSRSHSLFSVVVFVHARTVTGAGA